MYQNWDYPCFLLLIYLQTSSTSECYNLISILAHIFVSPSYILVWWQYMYIVCKLENYPANTYGTSLYTPYSQIWRLCSIHVYRLFGATHLYIYGSTRNMVWIFLTFRQCCYHKMYVTCANLV